LLSLPSKPRQLVGGGKSKKPDGKEGGREERKVTNVKNRRVFWAESGAGPADLGVVGPSYGRGPAALTAAYEGPKGSRI